MGNPSLEWISIHHGTFVWPTYEPNKADDTPPAVLMWDGLSLLPQNEYFRKFGPLDLKPQR